MSIRAAIYDLLNDADTDVYPVLAAVGEADPYGVYNLSRECIRSQDGIAVYDVTVTVDCYAKDFSDLVDFAATIETGLSNASGTYDDKTIMVSNLVTESEIAYDDTLDKYSLTQTYQVFIDN